MDGDDGEEKGVQKLNLKVKGLEGQQQVSMNTNALEVKINAVQILKNLARNLGASIFEHVEDISKVMIEKALCDPFAMTIRKESAKCMRFCIAACKEKPEHQRALFIMTYVRLIEELDKRTKRQEFDQINSILKELFKMLKNFYHFKKLNLTVFTVDDATTLIKRLADIIKLIQEDKKTRMKQIKAMGASVDEEDLEYFEEDLEKVDKGIHHIMEIAGFLVQNMGAAISPAIGQTLLPLYAVKLLDKDAKEYETIDSVCMLCDCMEHGSDALFNQIQQQAGPKFVELIHTGSSDKENLSYDLIQSCIFGLGIIAQRVPQGQFAQLSQVVTILGETCKQDTAGLNDEEKESKLMMADNSISTLSKIVLFQ